MSNKQLRTIIRIVHLVAGVCIIALVYNDTLRATPEFIAIMKMLVIPVVSISGLAMWQQAFVSRLRRRSSSTVGTAS